MGPTCYPILVTSKQHLTFLSTILPLKKSLFVHFLYHPSTLFKTYSCNINSFSDNGKLHDCWTIIQKLIMPSSDPTDTCFCQFWFNTVRGMTYLKNDKGIPRTGYAATNEHVGTEAGSLLSETWGTPTFLSNDQGIHFIGGVKQKLLNVFLLT